ncbi:hypothetical protein ALISP_7328 [Alicycliphilus sp. B1]|nr:hypothetical protein ALISP_7328 [Alicycliphilus sp. B1]
MKTYSGDRTIDGVIVLVDQARLLPDLGGAIFSDTGFEWVRIPLMADSDSISIADSVPCDGGHVARVS